MRKILIVDDETTILKGLKRALVELCGFRGDIKSVHNGKDAIEAFRSGFYDICFLDIKLPDINGLAVLKNIRKISPETNIILMSGCYRKTALDSVLDDNNIFYLDKPFDFSLVRSFVTLALNGSTGTVEGAEQTVYSGTAEKRTFKRKILTKLIGFYVRDSSLMEFKGGITDISFSGVGIHTYFPLEKGQILFFGKGIAHNAGIVSWSRKNGDNNYRAGIKFI